MVAGLCWQLSTLEPPLEYMLDRVDRNAAVHLHGVPGVGDLAGVNNRFPFLKTRQDQVKGIHSGANRA